MYSELQNGARKEMCVIVVKMTLSASHNRTVHGMIENHADLEFFKVQPCHRGNPPAECVKISSRLYHPTIQDFSRRVCSGRNVTELNSAQQSRTVQDAAQPNIYRQVLSQIVDNLLPPAIVDIIPELLESDVDDIVMMKFFRRNFVA